MSNYNFNIIKYSYKHSTARRTKLNITIPNIENPTNLLNSENESCIRYIKKSKISASIDNIIGVTFGSQTTTFMNVKKCKPWLCLSFILLSRTYDFEFLSYADLHRFCNLLSEKHRKLLDFTKIFAFKEKCKTMTKKSTETYVDFFKRVFANTLYCKCSISNDCPICLENQNDNIKLPCEHIFCKNCFVNWSKTSVVQKRRILCPLCRIDIINHNFETDNYRRNNLVELELR